MSLPGASSACDVGLSRALREQTGNNYTVPSPNFPDTPSMSHLQTQYPLSPRKFWKKFIGHLISWLIISILLRGVSTLVWFVASLSPRADARSNSMIIEWVVTILTAMIFVGLVLYAWYLRTYIKRYYYDAADNFVTIKKGVFTPVEIHVMYQKIQDVYVDQDILDRMMGLYDVHLASATATSGIEAHIDGVDHDSAEAIKTILLSKIQSGGSTSVGFSTHPNTKQATALVALSEDVSSKTYPLSGRWLTQKTIVAFFSSLLLSAILTVYIFDPGKTSGRSFGEEFGLSWTIWVWIFLMMFAGHVIYTLLWRSTYSFRFLPEYIMMKTGVISRREVHVPYRSVQDVTVTQGLVERMFGLATVNIENAAQAQAPQASQRFGRKGTESGITIPGQTPERASHIAEVVQNVALTKKHQANRLVAYACP